MREVRAGLTTFATMAYIIAVNVRGSNQMLEASLTITGRTHFAHWWLLRVQSR